MAEGPELKHSILNPDFLRKLGSSRMPFGKYAERRIIDLPEDYLVWFRRKGLPKGELGALLNAAYEIKINGLEYLFRRQRL